MNDGHIEELRHNSGSTLSPPVDQIANSKLPAMRLAVAHLNGNRLLPIVELKKVA